MFKTLLKGATIFYYYTFQQIFNICARTYWYVRIIVTGKWGATTKILNEVSASVNTYDDLNRVYSKFIYQYDGVVGGTSIFSKWPTWEPTPRILAERGFSDNCDGAVQFAQYLYKELLKTLPGLQDELIMKKRIMVPYDTWRHFFYRTHYVYEVVNAKEKWSTIYSSGKIMPIEIDEFCAAYTRTEKYILW